MAIPDAIKRYGPFPVVLEERFNSQLDYVINHILKNIGLDHETVGFLQAKGGGWFNEIRNRLRNEKFHFVEISGESYWSQMDLFLP
ncbi:hypothetical protein [Proteus sp. ZN5]|uniref:hypothetical protein n=1 Tax=Proteus sp. ZN5 TaxID=2697019 RepID=UPI0013E179DC|nr:hypothetical protein [Proteus sp. ZN5]QIG04909.1 hypothetical protein GTK47_05965 [Proteus sp. ZN5]